MFAAQVMRLIVPLGCDFTSDDAPCLMCRWQLDGGTVLEWIDLDTSSPGVGVALWGQTRPCFPVIIQQEASLGMAKSLIAGSPPALSN